MVEVLHINTERTWRTPRRTVMSRRVELSIFGHTVSISGLKNRIGVDRCIAMSQAVKRGMR